MYRPLLARFRNPNFVQFQYQAGGATGPVRSCSRLAHLGFWRIMLDEAQLVANTNSVAAQVRVRARPAARAPARRAQAYGWWWWGGRCQTLRVLEGLLVAAQVREGGRGRTYDSRPGRERGAAPLPSGHG